MILAQCPGLDHLDLSGWNGINAAAKRRLAASWCGEASVLVFYDDDDSSSSSEEEEEYDEDGLDQEEEV
jgi:hypothetical protein